MRLRLGVGVETAGLVALADAFGGFVVLSVLVVGIAFTGVGLLGLSVLSGLLVRGGGCNVLLAAGVCLFCFC